MSDRTVGASDELRVRSEPKAGPVEGRPEPLEGVKIVEPGMVVIHPTGIIEASGFTFEHYREGPAKDLVLDWIRGAVGDANVLLERVVLNDVANQGGAT